MLQTILDFRSAETVSLIPNSGIQFLDFAFRIGDVQRLSRAVTAVPRSDDPAAVTIYPVRDLDESTVYYPKGAQGPKEADPDTIYSVKAEAALGRFDRQWLPFPFFRRAGDRFDEGPTTWARIKVVRLAEPDEKGRTHRLVLAFDTLLTERLPGQPYASPEAESDATDKTFFGFCADHDRNAGFMSRPWVAGWLEEAYREGYARERGRAAAQVQITHEQSVRSSVVERVMP